MSGRVRGWSIRGLLIWGLGGWEVRMRRWDICGMKLLRSWIRMLVWLLDMRVQGKDVHGRSHEKNMLSCL